MEYYRAIGSDKATLIPRYFMTDDPGIKENAFEEIKGIMGSLVCLWLFLQEVHDWAKWSQTVEPLICEPGTKWNYGMQFWKQVSSQLLAKSWIVFPTFVIFRLLWIFLLIESLLTARTSQDKVWTGLASSWVRSWPSLIPSPNNTGIRLRDWHTCHLKNTVSKTSSRPWAWPLPHSGFWTILTWQPTSWKWILGTKTAK